MNLKIVGAAVAALAVSACASTPQETATASPPPSASAPAPGTVGDFQRVGDIAFFDFDSFALTNAARDTLRAQATWLQSYPAVTIRVEGNCDERGTREYNLALGERRANAARDFLVSLGVDPSRITIVSYGKERPRNPASNESAWSVNRNATTVILSGAVG